MLTSGLFMGKRYNTLYADGHSETVEKKSRFIARCARVKNEDEALGFIAEVKAAHKTASHNVYAYSLRENNLCRYSDDGEPQGTAGLPVLDILKRGDIVDAAIVVTRYFGGTLLGTGGLVRAYSEAASLAVKDARIAVMDSCSVYRIECEYPVYDKLQKLLENAGATVDTSSFSDIITLETAILSADAAGMIADISELTRGRTIPQHICDKFDCTEIKEI